MCKDTYNVIISTYTNKTGGNKKEIFLFSISTLLFKNNSLKISNTHKGRERSIINMHKINTHIQQLSTFHHACFRSSFFFLFKMYSEKKLKMGV